MQNRREKLFSNRQLGLRVYIRTVMIVPHEKSSSVFPHRNIHKYTWPSPEGQTNNQTDHILIDKRWHSSILDL